MLGFLAIVVGGFVAYALKSRIVALEGAVADLQERFRLLEAAHQRRAAATETPKPLSRPAPLPPRPLVVERPVVAPPDAPPKPMPAPPAASIGDSLEARIGSRWLLYVGVCSIVIGLAYFEKLAVDRRWIGGAARVIQGAIAGVGFVVTGLRFARRGLRRYGHVLSGTGVAMLYLSIYAAFNFYHLVDRPAAFTMMSGVTLVAAALADQQLSLLLALFAIGGGFATPFLMPSPDASEVALFGYDTVLIAGTMFMARRRCWPVLNGVSYVFTLLTAVWWLATFYKPSTYLATELFLTLFCAMYLSALRANRTYAGPVADFVGLVLKTGQALYYLMSLAILAPHSSALLIYLIAIATLGVAVGSKASGLVRLGFWAAAAVPLLFWSRTSAGQDLVGRGLLTWSVVYALNLIGLLEATLRDDGMFGDVDVAHLHANGLGALAGACLLLAPSSSGEAASAAAALALVNFVGAVGVGVEKRDEALHFVALAFTLLTAAIGLQFEGASLTLAWAAEGALVVALALRERRAWLRAGGLLLLAAAVVRLLLLEAARPSLAQTVLLNERGLCGLFVSGMVLAATYAHHRLEDPERRANSVSIGLVAAALLLLTVAGGEIAAYWDLHVRRPFEPGSQLIVASLTAGAAIVWLGLARMQAWVRSIGGAIIAGAVLALLSSQFAPAPPGYSVVLNGRFGAGLFAVLVCYGLARLHRRRVAPTSGSVAEVTVLTTGASLLTLSMLTSEIEAFWTGRGAVPAVSIAHESLQVVAWAAIGSLLLRRASFRWDRWIGGAILASAVVRLVRLQLFHVAAGYVILANPRVVAGAITIALLYGLSRADRAARPEGRLGTALLVAANAMMLALLTSEITAYWQLRELGRPAVAAATADFAREMMLSVTWALYATTLVVVGLKKRYAPIRYLAIAVFVVTISKVFAVDIAELDQIYRILSVIGLGAALLVSSYVYQRFRRNEREG